VPGRRDRIGKLESDQVRENVAVGTFNIRFHCSQVGRVSVLAFFDSPANRISLSPRALVSAQVRKSTRPEADTTLAHGVSHGHADANTNERPEADTIVAPNYSQVCFSSYSISCLSNNNTNSS
jgi:hypothetical protein